MIPMSAIDTMNVDQLKSELRDRQMALIDWKTRYQEFSANLAKFADVEAKIELCKAMTGVELLPRPANDYPDVITRVATEVISVAPDSTMHEVVQAMYKALTNYRGTTMGQVNVDCGYKGISLKIPFKYTRSPTEILAAMGNDLANYNDFVLKTLSRDSSQLAACLVQHGIGNGEPGDLFSYRMYWMRSTSGIRCFDANQLRSHLATLPMLEDLTLEAFKGTHHAKTFQYVAATATWTVADPVA